MARNPRDAYRDSVMFGEFIGLRNTVSKTRLKAPRSGELMEPAELVKALNIDIDDALQARRRRGFTQVGTGVYHSLWAGASDTFVVKDGALGTLAADYSFTPIRAGVGSDPLAYVQVGDTVYYAGATTSGKVLADMSYAAWGTTDGGGEWVSPITRPTSYVDEVAGKYLTAPPTATALVESNGRIYLADDHVLWATEYLMFDHVDRTRNFMQFEGKITALGAVGGGFYVGTTQGTYFLAGPLAEMSRKEVNTYATLPRSMVAADPQVIGERPSGQQAVIYMTDHGICVGLDGGESYNLTKRRVTLPAADTVAALFREQDGINQYIGVADSGGSPSSKARIGDYVDAEIIRFQGD